MSCIAEVGFRILKSVYHLVMGLVSPVLDARSAYYLRRIRNKATASKASGRIRVAFFVFEPETWDKQEPVFREMENRDDFEVEIVVVPNFNSSFGVRSVYGRELEFFKTVSDNVTPAYSEDGKLIDLSKRDYDYIFYGDSYNRHMPWKLRSHQAIRYSKICYVPYGYTGSSVFDPISDNREFFRNVYMTFFDIEEKVSNMRTAFRKTCSLGLQHFEYLGYPALEKYYFAEGSSLGVEGSAPVVSWTPRWSYDEKIGGSHFLEYKDDFLDLAERSSHFDYILRPHPMMFCEFLSKGLMTESSVALYKDRLNGLGVKLSEEESITDVLLGTDILISDYSSILMMFFLTGRPIIYCDSSIPFNNAYNKMRQGMYIANSWADVERYIDSIDKGDDFLKEKRESIIRDYFGDMEGSAARIVDKLIADYAGMAN